MHLRGLPVQRRRVRALRVAAVEQLATWAERGGAEIVRPQQQGQDPASVAFQTVERAQREGIDIALIDTAGRLQTKSGLMYELGKIRRVVEKQTEIAEVLLVLDATTGQNALRQVEDIVDRHPEARAELEGALGPGGVDALRQATLLVAAAVVQVEARRADGGADSGAEGTPPPAP